MRSRSATTERGQILVLFVLSLVVMLLMAGLVVDAGYAYSQNRIVQNASDFAAMAGTRIVGEELTGNATNGTALNVYQAIDSALAANHAQLVTAKYVDSSGNVKGDVVALGTAPGSGNPGTIPSGANGVVVNASTSWHPFFLGIIGVSSWSAGTTATAITPGTSTGGGVLPIGMQDSTYDGLTACPVSNLNSCISQNLTSGALNIPGGFGWLKFGATGKCAGFGLGMDPNAGCDTSQPFLQSEVGPPPNSYGCCTAVTGGASPADQIGSLTGNKPANLSYYIENQIPVWVPIWDKDASQGANGYYHIVGFGAIVFVGQDTQHGKWLTGAAISGVGCPGAGNSQVPGTSYCKGSGGAFTIGVTGAVHLVH
jgi:hypothetical protein